MHGIGIRRRASCQADWTEQIMPFSKLGGVLLHRDDRVLFNIDLFRELAM